MNNANAKEVIGENIVQQKTAISAVNEILSGYKPGFELVADARQDAQLNDLPYFMCEVYRACYYHLHIKS